MSFLKAIILIYFNLFSYPCAAYFSFSNLFVSMQNIFYYPTVNLGVLEFLVSEVPDENDGLELPKEDDDEPLLNDCEEPTEPDGPAIFVHCSFLTPKVNVTVTFQPVGHFLNSVMRMRLNLTRGQFYFDHLLTPISTGSGSAMGRGLASKPTTYRAMKIYKLMRSRFLNEIKPNPSYNYQGDQ